MNHLSRKNRLHGAGSKQPKVKPAVLLPPKIGDFQFGSSFSFLETLDLISDGPIEGLVDSEGKILDDKNLSKGIYLDDTAISVSSGDVEIDYDLSLSEKNKILLNTNVFSSLPKLAGAVQYSDFPVRLVGGVYQTGGKERVIIYNWEKIYRSLDNEVAESTWVQGSVRSSNSGLETHLAYNKVSGSFKGLRHIALNNTNFGNSEAAIAFADFKSDQKDLNLSENIAHFFSEKESTKYHFFKEIKDAIAEYGPPANSEEPKNKFMYDMIVSKMNRAFGSFDWKNKTAQTLHETLFRRRGFALVYYPSRGILNGSTPITFTDDAGAVQFDFANSSDIITNLSGEAEIVNLLMPVCDANRQVDVSEDVIGGIFFFVDIDKFQYDFGDNGNLYTQHIKYLNSKLKTLTKLVLTQDVRFGSVVTDVLKYNYNNVLIENRRGEEKQDPFNFFNKVFVDKVIDKNVYGPFKKEGGVQRISAQGYNKSTLSMSSAQYGVNVQLDDQGIPTDEGSNDQRQVTKEDYSSWNNKNYSYDKNEKESPVTYIIHNPNVSQVFVTLRIDSLFDTIEKGASGGDEDSFKTGDKYPAVMNIQLEVGKILPDGSAQPYNSETYRISALIEGPTLLDIGNPDAFIGENNTQYKFIRYARDANSRQTGEVVDVSKPILLPAVYGNSKNNVFSSSEKRYIKVSKLSTETFSVLMSKDLSFYKVTEILPINLSYPFSAIIGTKIDSKSFSSVPNRTFDARLKLVPIPSNYYPTKAFGGKKDKRYYDRVSLFNQADESDKEIYEGDWNGQFKMGWTDNPAWILYDLLTNSRYGLGQYVESSDINKWELYKVGRFCDAVDSKGQFEGVPDGRGGLEPRYSCNIVFKSDEKVFDAIQTLSRIFRGHTFFRSSEVSFSDERIKSPIATFSNINVKEGIFDYSNLRRDQQFNTVEVSYLDRFENFSPKVETVEDEEDIRSRGIFKNRIDGIGVTSRAMARRVGQHLIYKTIKENQRVVFTSGLEALLCQPGDLIIIDDDLKNQKTNFGKILDINVSEEVIRLSGPYSDSSMTGILTVYNPTGNSSIQDLNEIAITKRQRLEGFTVTDSFEADFNIYTGEYQFSGYRGGYDISNIEDSELSSEYALYTGTGDNILYFDPTYTGWIFGTSLNESLDHYISQDTGVQSIAQLNTGKLVNYKIFSFNKRDTTEFNIADFFSGDLEDVYDRGILESEIQLNSESQITTFNVTGDVAPSGDFGSYVSGVDTPQYLPFIKLGSPYRFDLKLKDDVIYKVESIKESNPNEYLVSASKFDTGKFSLIENDISIDKRENTYDYNVQTQIGDSTYTSLTAPQNLSIATGQGANSDTFYISGSWDSVTNNNGYEAVLRNPNTTTSTASADSSTNYVVFDNLSSVGSYSLSVKSVGDSSTNNKYLDSEFSTVTSFILYDEIEEFSKSFTNLITFK